MNSSLIFSPETISSPFTLILLLLVGIGTGTISGILGIGGGLFRWLRALRVLPSKVRFLRVAELSGTLR